MLNFLSNIFKFISQILKENWYDIVFYFFLIIFSITFVWYLDYFIFLIKNKSNYLKVVSDYAICLAIHRYNPMDTVLDIFLDPDVFDKKTLYWHFLSLDLNELLSLLPDKYRTYGVVQYIVISWWSADIFGKTAIKIFLISVIHELPLDDEDINWLFTLLLEESRGSGSPYKMSLAKNSESKISSLFKEDLSVSKGDIDKFCISKDSYIPKDINFDQLDHLISYFQTLNKKPISENIVPENIVPESLTYLDYIYNNTIYIIEIIKNIIF